MLLTQASSSTACRRPRGGVAPRSPQAPSHRTVASAPACRARARGPTTRLLFATANDSGVPSDGEVVPLAALPPASSSYAGLRLLVVGGGGGVGRAVCAAAAAEGVPVTALVRDTAAARAVLPSSVALVRGDVTRFASLAAALDAAGDFNAVVWAAGSNSLAGFSRGVREGGPAGLVRALAAAANPLTARGVELGGVENLLAILQRRKEGGPLKSLVLVSSIGADDPLAQAAFPGLVLLWKKRAEEAVQRSGLPHTIVRPGGLKNDKKTGDTSASSSIASPGSADLVMTGPDGIGVGGGRRRPGSIRRAQVADVCLAALVTPEAAGKVVEVVADGKGGGARAPWADLFAGTEQ